MAITPRRKKTEFSVIETQPSIESTPISNSDALRDQMIAIIKAQGLHHDPYHDRVLPARDKDIEKLADELLKAVK